MLDLGEAMLYSGAEIHRIEDSLVRVGQAFNARSTEAFVLVSFISLTVEFEDGSALTQTRRILKGTSYDLDMLEALNSLCRDCNGLTVDEFTDRLNAIIKKRPSFKKVFWGSILAAGAFTLFFGGNPLDAVIACVFAILIFFMQNSKFSPNRVFFYLVSSFTVGIAIYLLSAVIPYIDPAKILIGDIMLLIPGLAITNAGRDVLIGDTVSALTRFLESLLYAISLASGIMLAMFLSGGIL